MGDKMTNEDAAHYHNVREFGDFIEALSLDQFIGWVYRVFAVPPDEVSEIEESYLED